MRIAAPWLALPIATAAPMVGGCGPSEIAGPLPDAVGARAEAPPAAQADATPGGPGPLLGSFELTYYDVAAESDYAETGDDTTLYQPDCDVLAIVPSRFAEALLIEGTGELADGRVVNYTGACPCAFTPCFRFEDAEHPWGSGAGDRRFVHDGCVSADDTGGHILGMHIDFFSALRSYYLVLDGDLQLNDVTIYQGGARCP